MTFDKILYTETVTLFHQEDSLINLLNVLIREIIRYIDSTWRAVVHGDYYVTFT